METKLEPKSSLVKSAGVVSFATLVSRVLGLVREQVTAYLFGASDMVDAFKSAFRIPNLLRDLFAEGALSAGFVPMFSEKLRRAGREEAMRFAGLVFGALTAVVSAIVLLMIAVAPEVAVLIAEGFERVPGKLDMTVDMARVMMPFLLIVSLSALLMGISNSLGRFFVPALAPALINLGMIICGLALSRWLEPPVMSLAIGVLLGGVAQFLLQFLALRRVGFRFEIVFDLINPELLKLMLLILPTTIGLAATQVNVAVVTRLASTESGAVAYLDYAFRLLHLPLGLFAVAIATVTLPRLSGEAAVGNSLEFSRIHSQALRLGLFLSLPATALLVVLNKEICAAIFQYGAFSRADTVLTAQALAMYAVGLPFFTLVRITAPAFFALRDTRTPAIIAVISVAVNVFLCFQFRERFGFIGLALAASLAGVANFTLLTYLLRKRTRIIGDNQTLIVAAKIIAVAAVTAAFALLARHYVVRQFLEDQLHHLPQLLFLLAAAALGFIVSCRLLRVEEWSTFSDALARRLRKSR